MALAVLKPSRSVLIIGDEALSVYNVTARSAKLVDTVPWQAEDFVSVVAGLIRRECGGKPVLMLNDMTDQHFKGGQRLPKVGPMDKANVLSRRLAVAFPNFAIRGALPVKEVVKGIGRPRKAAGGLYLFAAVPVSEAVRKTMDAVRESMAPIAAFALLPVEASDMVSSLAKAMAGKERATSKWGVFIGQHQSGALRQVITRDGQLAMTRMTPVIDTDSDPNVWADEVAQEFRATVSYLSRFGYSADDGTDVFVIANDAAGAALGRKIGIPCNYYSFTAQEAARELDIAIGIQESARYADPLHAAWAGRKLQFTLPMQAPELANIHKPRQFAALFGVLLLGAAAYMAWTMSGHFSALSEAREQTAQQERMLRDIEVSYNAEVQRMEALGFDVKLVQGAINAYEGLEGSSIKTMSTLKNINDALGDDLRIDMLTIGRVAPHKPQPGAAPRYDKDGNEIIPRAQMNAVMSMTFPATIDPEVGVREVNNLERRLRALFPGMTVSIDKQVADMAHTESMSMELGVNANAATKDYIAVLSIKGELK